MSNLFAYAIPFKAPKICFSMLLLDVPRETSIITSLNALMNTEIIRTKALAR
jgi:hypothetical protein